MIDKTREVALKILYKIDEENAYSNIVLDDMLKQNKKILNDKDVGLISEIVYGVTTWKLTLDTIIDKHSKIKLKKISPWILNVLRMGIYQIIFLDKIPKSAAVNESVNLAKRYGHKSSSNFVNAILRKVENKDYEELFDIENDIERISKTTSMPIWIIEELLKDEEMTIDKIEEICKNSNIKPKISIRVNNLKTNKNDLKEKLENELQKDVKSKLSKIHENTIEGVEYKKIVKVEVEDGILEDFLLINRIKNIENLESFKEGIFTIQDEAAGLVPLVLQPKENDIVLDACSAPGGKTTYIAELMNNKGKIEAWDIHQHRIDLVNKNAERLGIKIIETKLQDATKFNESYLEKFDKILLDVPCLGIGVLKRKPDIKWQRKKEDVEEITKIQMQILENCSKYLKENGELVYSTCSILKDENENLIKKFLKNNKNFELIKINLKNIENEKNNNKKFFEKYIEKNGFLQVYQNERTDGFFICKLQKKQV